jgi:hypothetical protein
VLKIIEAQGTSSLCIRSFAAARPSGLRIPQATSDSNLFARKVNSAAGWTSNISRTDLIRSDYDKTHPVDACNLQLLYRGFDLRTLETDIALVPYDTGLLAFNTTITSATPFDSTTSSTSMFTLASITLIITACAEATTLTRTTMRTTTKTIAGSRGG